MNDSNEYGGNRDPQDRFIEDEAAGAELDALIARFGADYNAPPDLIPREEMWHVIRSRGTQQRSERMRSTVSLLTAAVVLLAAGIGIGVEAHSRIVSRPNPAVIASAPAGSVAPVQSADANRSDANITEGSHAPAASARSPQAKPSASYANNTRNGTVAESGDAAQSTAYSLATVRHFTAVEALLTSYQTSQRDARSDAQMAAWARALLSQTRLLLDSPAAKDPVRNKLLQDLELILVQMTQLSPANTTIDRESLDGSVTHSDVITRLRTAVPGGAATTL